MTTTATAEGAGSSLDRVRLLKDLQAQARLLEDDLRERMDAEPEFRSALRVEYDKAVAAERTAAMYEMWHDEPRVVQIARVGAGVLLWETHDVATACQLPIVGPALDGALLAAVRPAARAAPLQPPLPGNLLMELRKPLSLSGLERACGVTYPLPPRP